MPPARQQRRTSAAATRLRAVTQTEWKASAHSTPKSSECDRKMMSIRYLFTDMSLRRLGD